MITKKIGRPYPAAFDRILRDMRAVVDHIICRGCRRFQNSKASGVSQTFATGCRLRHSDFITRCESAYRQQGLIAAGSLHDSCRRRVVDRGDAVRSMRGELRRY